MAAFCSSPRDLEIYQGRYVLQAVAFYKFTGYGRERIGLRVFNTNFPQAPLQSCNMSFHIEKKSFVPSHNLITSIGKKKTAVIRVDADLVFREEVSVEVCCFHIKRLYGSKVQRRNSLSF